MLPPISQSCDVSHTRTLRDASFAQAPTKTPRRARISKQLCPYLPSSPSRCLHVAVLESQSYQDLPLIAYLTYTNLRFVCVCPHSHSDRSHASEAIVDQVRTSNGQVAPLRSRPCHSPQTGMQCLRCQSQPLFPVTPSPAPVKAMRQERVRDPSMCSISTQRITHLKRPSSPMTARPFPGTSLSK